MTKSPARPAKPASSGTADDGPKKRRLLKLGLMALAPLLLAGGGYAGWTMLAGAEAGGVAHAAEGEDTMQVSSIATKLAAETSFTHTYALSVLIAQRCGAANAPALKAASDEEAHTNGMLATLSWQAAARRVAATTEKSCVFLRQEVTEGEFRAMELAKKKGKTAVH